MTTTTMTPKIMGLALNLFLFVGCGQESADPHVSTLHKEADKMGADAFKLIQQIIPESTVPTTNLTYSIYGKSYVLKERPLPKEAYVNFKALLEHLPKYSLGAARTEALLQSDVALLKSAPQSLFARPDARALLRTVAGASDIYACTQRLSALGTLSSASIASRCRYATSVFFMKELPGLLKLAKQSLNTENEDALAGINKISIVLRDILSVFDQAQENVVINAREQVTKALEDLDQLKTELEALTAELTEGQEKADRVLQDAASGLPLGALQMLGSLDGLIGAQEAGHDPEAAAGNLKGDLLGAIDQAIGQMAEASDQAAAQKIRDPAKAASYRDIVNMLDEMHKHWNPKEGTALYNLTQTLNASLKANLASSVKASQISERTFELHKNTYGILGPYLNSALQNSHCVLVKDCP